jgi:ribosomal subunit interface protein
VFFIEHRLFFYHVSRLDSAFFAVLSERKGGQMTVIVQSKTFVVTEALRAFVTQQVQKLLKHSKKILEVVVFLEMVKRKKNDVYSASAQFVIVMPQRRVVVRQKAKDLYIAISEAARSTLRQVGRVKERRLARALRFVE